MEQPGFFDKFFRALFLTCPVCWNGPMFEHPLKMHDDCPSCGYHFDKGNGYFLGAMYGSYMLCLIPTLFTGVVLYFMGVPNWLTIAIVAAQTAILGPFVFFPLSRVFWVWAERDGHLHDGNEDRERLKAEAIERGRRQP